MHWQDRCQCVCKKNKKQHKKSVQKSEGYWSYLKGNNILTGRSEYHLTLESISATTLTGTPLLPSPNMIAKHAPNEKNVLKNK